MRRAASGNVEAVFGNAFRSPGPRCTVVAVFVQGAAGRTGRRISLRCFSPKPSETKTSVPSPGTAPAVTGKLSVSLASFASFSSPWTGRASDTLPPAMRS